MKKLLFVLAIFGMLATTTTYAQNKALNKALKKELSQKKKDFKKRGFQIFGTSRSLDVALLRYYEALEEGGDAVFEWVGYATGKSKGLLVTAAENNARARYATLAQSQIKGQIKQKMQANSADVSEEEIDKFEAVYLTKVEAELKGLLKPSFSIIKTDEKTGVSDLETYYVVDETAAGKARLAAAKRALEEANIKSEAGDIISSAAEEKVIPE